MQELSAGQVTTMARNEKVIEKLSGQPAVCGLKRCLTVPWCNDKVIEKVPGHPATSALRRCFTVPWFNGHPGPPACDRSPVCWTRAGAG